MDRVAASRRPPHRIRRVVSRHLGCRTPPATHPTCRAPSLVVYLLTRATISR